MKRFPYGKSVYGIVFMAFLFIIASIRFLYSATYPFLSLAFFLLGLSLMFFGYTYRITTFMQEVFEDLKATGIHRPKFGRGTQRLLVRFALFLGPFAAGFFVPSDETRAAFTSGRVLGYLLAELYRTYLARNFEKREGKRIYYEFRGSDRVIFTKERERVFCEMMIPDQPESSDEEPIPR